MKKTFKPIGIWSVLTLAVLINLAGCSKREAALQPAGSVGPEPYEITVMLPAYRTEIIAEDSPVKKRLEELTNTRLNLTWVPSASYIDKLNITLASGNLPKLLVVLEKTSAILSGVKAGAFWEVGPYLKDYPNLSQANPDILWNSSINGKYYGVYRSRVYGRNGIIYRRDWLERLGLSEPRTVEDLYRVLYAFAHNDPDGNGKQDTYGVAFSKDKFNFQITLPWFGAPNKWGFDSEGQLIPDFMTKEYKAALKFWKKCYAEKLINQDFAVFEPTKMVDLFRGGKVGLLIDVADEARRSDEKMVEADPKLAGAVGVMGAVEGTYGLRNLPTPGYNGMFMFPKSSLKTESDVKRVLQFLDDLCGKEAQILITNGLEGVNYRLEDGFAVPINPAPPLTVRGELDQLQVGIPEDRFLLPPQTPVRQKVYQIWKENLKTAVANPAEPYVSSTYTTKGAQLDNIIEAARVKYIVGLIDDLKFDEAVELWKKSGGNDVIKEINVEHAEYGKRK